MHHLCQQEIDEQTILSSSVSASVRTGASPRHRAWNWQMQMRRSTDGVREAEDGIEAEGRRRQSPAFVRGDLFVQRRNALLVGPVGTVDRQAARRTVRSGVTIAAAASTDGAAIVVRRTTVAYFLLVGRGSALVILRH